MKDWHSSILHLTIVHDMLNLGVFYPQLYIPHYQYEDGEACSADLSKMTLLFFEIVEFLESLGIHVDFDKAESECSDMFVSFESISMDMSEMQITPSVIEYGKNCAYGLILVYLVLRSGAALPKHSFEELMGQPLTPYLFNRIKDEMLEATGYELVKKKDNSYFFGDIKR